MLDACVKHGWRPRAGPGGAGAAGLCPGCIAEADLKSGRTYLDPDEQIREGSPRSKDPNQRRHIDLGLVSDGPPVSTRYKSTAYMDELWSQHLARQRDTRREEEQGLIEIEAARRRRERQERPRRRRVMMSKWENGEWHNVYAPERRSPITIEIEDY